ncbi:MAG: hypothetical protein DMF71_15575 [Acidobacteria bacterium]|nr:MAG: hypothetical protein DMF71_15575 [Acidobacteriota bacterium]
MVGRFPVWLLSKPVCPLPRRLRALTQPAWVTIQRQSPATGPICFAILIRMRRIRRHSFSTSVASNPIRRWPPTPEASMAHRLNALISLSSRTYAFTKESMASSCVVKLSMFSTIRTSGAS